METRYVSNGLQSYGLIPIMESNCVYCRRDVRREDGLFYALSKPYYGILHRWCAPYFSWNGQWPHSNPVVYYNTVGSEPNNNFPPPGTMINVNPIH